MRVPEGANCRFTGGAERVFGMGLVLVELEDAIEEEGKIKIFLTGRSHRGAV